MALIQNAQQPDIEQHAVLCQQVIEARIIPVPAEPDRFAAARFLRDKHRNGADAAHVPVEVLVVLEEAVVPPDGFPGFECGGIGVHQRGIEGPFHIPGVSRPERRRLRNSELDGLRFQPTGRTRAARLTHPTRRPRHLAPSSTR